MKLRVREHEKHLLLHTLLIAGVLLFTLSAASWAKAYNFTTNTTISSTNTTYDGGDITVTGCTVTIDGAHSFNSFYITGNGTENGAITHDAGFVGGMNLTIATNFTIDSGSKIDIGGRGYSAGQGPGAGGSVSGTKGPGGGGAGYGGEGTSGTNGGYGGGCYGSIQAPTDLGSGGGTGDEASATGGNGGGAVELTVNGTLALNGEINADGVSGPNDAGGGSGGSIYIANVSTFTGSGYIHSNGGYGQTSNDGYDTSGGAGGAGRIAIYYATASSNQFTGTIQAWGNNSKYAGNSGAGSIYTKSPPETYGDLYVANQFVAGATSLTKPETFDNVSIGPGGVLDTSTGNLTLTVIGNLTVQSSGYIDADARGYGSGEGPSPGGSVGSGAYYDGGGGGSYGGLGTGGVNGAGPGPITYGSITLPTDFGSGGGTGDAGNSPGGWGGGAINIVVGNTLADDGTITSSGGANGGDAGGGAGGSILLKAGTLSGGGTIRADGGYGNTNNGNNRSGGAGGGGRIALYYVTNDFTGDVDVNGGGSYGAGNGAPGTVYTQAIQGTYAIKKFTVNPTLVGGTVSSTATISLNKAAGAGGVLVSLKSGSTAIAAVPVSGQVTIPQGAITVTFPITTSSTTAPQTATITAGVNGTTASANLQVYPWLVSLTPSVVSVDTKDIETLTIKTDLPAPTGGLPVKLTTSDKIAAPVPSSVTIPAGKTSITVSFTVGKVTAAEVVNLSANFGVESQTTQIYVDKAGTLASIILSPTSVIGGVGVSIGTVTLTKRAASGGTIVALTNSNPDVASFPAYVTVEAGRSSEPFVITTNQVNAATTVAVTGTLGATSTANLNVQVQGIASLAFVPSSVVGGQTSIGIVTLQAAPSMPVTVTLTSSNPAQATPTDTIVIAPGQTVGTFYVDTAETYTEATLSPTITATANGTSVSATLTITATPAPSLTLTPSTVVGGHNSSLQVTLSDVSSVDRIVNLTSSSTVAAVPATIKIKAGTVSATATVTTTPLNATNTAVTIRATIGSESSTATLTVTPPNVTTVTVNPTAVYGGNAVTGSVTLSDSAPTGGMTVTLSQSGAAVTLPSTVTIAAGSKSGTFTIGTTVIPAAANATIIGSFNGVNQSATLTINPIKVASVRLSSSSVKGGVGNPTGTVTLNAPAPQAITITVTSSNSSVATIASPGTVTIAAGATTSSTFTVKTVAVTSSSSAMISASYNQSTSAALLAVTS